MLLARIYEVFPLVCPLCGAAMLIIAVVTDGPTVRDIRTQPPTRPRPRESAATSARSSTSPNIHA